MPNINVVIVDVNGSFRRFITETPKEARSALADLAIRPTTFALLNRMRATVPVGPEAPHIKDLLAAKMNRSGLIGQVGIFDNDEEAHVALFNEYAPNHQPFMRPAADAEQGDLVRRATAALQQVERNLSTGGGLI